MKDGPQKAAEELRRRSSAQRAAAKHVANIAMFVSGGYKDESGCHPLNNHPSSRGAMVARFLGAERMAERYTASRSGTASGIGAHGSSLTLRFCRNRLVSRQPSVQNVGVVPKQSLHLGPRVRSLGKKRGCRTEIP